MQNNRFLERRRNMNIKRIIKQGIRKTIGDQGVNKFKILLDKNKRNRLGYIEVSSYEITSFGKDGEQTFFGYYDKTPFSKDDSMVLGTVARCGNRVPRKDDILLIGYYDIANSKVFNTVGETNTWCWQQGCRLQWHPKNETSLIVYNKTVNNGYGAIIQDIRNGKVIEELDFPIYDIDHNGKLALTLNFSRLGRLRPGYGYVNYSDSTQNEIAPKNDGIWIYDLETKRNKLIISLEQLSNLKPSMTMDGANHYVNHLLFSPSSKRFLFFHLWLNNGKRYSRLLTSDIDGNNIHLLTNEGKVSHYTWKSTDEILATIHYDSMGTRYYLLNNTKFESKIIYNEHLDSDGHPSYSRNGILLTDTYPDKNGDRKLVLIDTEGTKNVIGKFYSPFEYNGECRCDLHPRWNRFGNALIFDSAHSGERKMYMMKIDKL